MSLSGKTSALENLFARILKDRDSKEKCECTRDFLSFWECYDAIYKANHIKIISELYLKREQTLEDIAFNCYIDDKTLYRYRQKYMESVRFFLTKHGIDF